MTETTKPTLDQLKALLAQFDASDVKKLLTEAEKNKPTQLSITMDVITEHVKRGAAMLTDALCTIITERALTAGVLKEGDKAQASSVASLVRYHKAAVEAIERAGGSVVWAPAEEAEKTDDNAEQAPDAPVMPAGDDNANGVGPDYTVAGSQQQSPKDKRKAA